jgi:sugar phosphate isomerase/epimerase
VATKRRFGVSTRLYEGKRLGRDHLLEIAAHGFGVVEIPAARRHLDFANPAVVADLQQWLAEAGLDLQGLHLPAGVPAADADAAVLVARRIPMPALTVRIGKPRDGARTIERLAEAAAPLGVTIAVDSNSEALTTVGSLVHFAEGFDARIGVAFDCASVKRPDELADAIETASEHLVTMHLPVESRIDWASALTTLQKVGYEGPLIVEPPPRTSPKDMLRLAREARERFEKQLCTST